MSAVSMRTEPMTYGTATPSPARAAAAGPNWTTYYMNSKGVVVFVE
jgi:hypothetical protein